MQDPGRALINKESRNPQHLRPTAASLKSMFQEGLLAFLFRTSQPKSTKSEHRGLDHCKLSSNIHPKPYSKCQGPYITCGTAALLTP